MSQQTQAYIIYNPVYRKVKKHIKRNGFRNYIINTWNVCLDKFNNVFDMKLVWINGGDLKLVKFLDDLTVESNYSDCWSKMPTISVEHSDFTELTDFIKANELLCYIEKIETRTRLSLVRVTEKVITFHPTILSTRILTKFQRSPIVVEHERCLYIAKAYEWLTQSGLNHFQKKIHYPHTHVAIYLLLDYYRKQSRRRNIRVFNLFDLCSLRLAMFDPRYYQYDQCEIPRLIHSELSGIIKQRKKMNPTFNFSASEYLIEQGIETVPPSIAEYFIICVSDYCRFVSQSDLVATHYSYLVDVDEYVRLYGDELYEDFLVDFLEKRPYLRIGIMSTSHCINPSLFRKILNFPNIFNISINTNFFVIDYFQTAESITTQKILENINLTFTGDSEMNYLANYISVLKLFNIGRSIVLNVVCPVVDYTIFNDLLVEQIKFTGHQINIKMITELHQTKLDEIRYRWNEASLEKNIKVLKMLQEFYLAYELDIVLDDNTFEIIFNFIEVMFLAYNRNELKFGSDLIKFNVTVRVDEIQKLILSDYVFKLNSERIKIEIYEKNSNTVVDLYDILSKTVHSAEPDDEYDFYQ